MVSHCRRGEFIPAEAANDEPAGRDLCAVGRNVLALLNFVVRSERPLGRCGAIRTQPNSAPELRPDLFAVTTLEEQIAETRSTPRTGALDWLFRVCALALAALGIFGLMAHETNRRTQEFGVRLPLVNSRAALHWNVGRALKLVGFGLLFGCAGRGLPAPWFEVYYSTLRRMILSRILAPRRFISSRRVCGRWPAWRRPINPVQALRHE